MDCSEALDRVAPYLDGELSPGEREQMDDHIGRCTACGRRIGSMSARPLARPGPGPVFDRPEFWSRLDAALDVEIERAARFGARPGRSGWFSHPMGVTASALTAYAALLLGAIVWGLWNLGEAREARRAATELSIQLDRERRLAAQPSDPAPLTGYTLATHTPHRGTF